MTRNQRLGAIVVVWLAFAVASAMMFVAITNLLGPLPTLVLDALGILFLVGTLLAILTEEHL